MTQISVICHHVFMGGCQCPVDLAVLLTQLFSLSLHCTFLSEIKCMYVCMHVSTFDKMCYVDLTPLKISQMLLFPTNMSVTCHCAHCFQDSRAVTHVAWEREEFHMAIQPSRAQHTPNLCFQPQFSPKSANTATVLL